MIQLARLRPERSSPYSPTDSSGPGRKRNVSGERDPCEINKPFSFSRSCHRGSTTGPAAEQLGAFGRERADERRAAAATDVPSGIAFSETRPSINKTGGQAPAASFLGESRVSEQVDPATGTSF